jgi:homoserine acetyltransferase
MCTSYSYTTVMSDSRDWMYVGFKKGGYHSHEWFANTQEFVDHVVALSQIDNIRCSCIKCRNMLSHTKS